MASVCVKLYKRFIDGKPTLSVLYNDNSDNSKFFLTLKHIKFLEKKMKVIDYNAKNRYYLY